MLRDVVPCLCWTVSVRQANMDMTRTDLISPVWEMNGGFCVAPEGTGRLAEWFENVGNF